MARGEKKKPNGDETPGSKEKEEEGNQLNGNLQRG
jgi:hypothetical protein